MVAEDGETVKGYTRYGAWYGDPYADWDTMFLSFCLHYAGVEDVPMDADCGSWATAWADGFVPAQSHETAAGDLVFFDRDGDGAADHAGLVTEVTDSGFTAIEGDAEDAVRLLSYLPVLSRWDYDGLKVAPCRYSGSLYQNNLIICAHNYASHFGKLKNLRVGDTAIFTDMDENIVRFQMVARETIQPEDLEAMEAGDWDLTLFTCTVGGQTRVTIRFEREVE